MNESRTARLRELLRRLGQAVHSSVAGSDEVRACLEDLHGDGWQAVMLLETSLACDENGSVETDRGTMRLHINADTPNPQYRLDVDDARFLSSLGIASGRHRSPGSSGPRTRAKRDAEGES